MGDRIDARVANIDKKDRKLSLSVKAHEMAEEKQAMAEYGSSDSGASLGDILGAALTRAREEGEDAPADEAPAAPVEAAAEEAPAEEAAAEEVASEEAPADDADAGGKEKP